MVVKKKQYNVLPEASAYDIQAHNIQTFNPDMKESATVNSGWVSEDFELIVRDIMLSTRMLLNSRPVFVDTKRMDIQSNINDKTINYPMQFNNSNSELNYNI